MRGDLAGLQAHQESLDPTDGMVAFPYGLDHAHVDDGPFGPTAGVRPLARYGVRNVQESAGLLPYRWHEGRLQVFLVHSDGRYWERKLGGTWQIANGPPLPGESLLNTALRELEDEVGMRPTAIPWPLASIPQKGGKWVKAFAVEAELEPANLVSNMFELEWPPCSRTVQSLPEIERANWFTLEEARAKMLTSQMPLLLALEQAVPAR
jgi:predicted NUDIX family NTP pyrophosphohydrolase